MIGDAIAQAMIACIVVAAIVGAGAVLFCVYVVPWLWGFVKPWLHVLTS